MVKTENPPIGAQTGNIHGNGIRKTTSKSNKDMGHLIRKIRDI